MARSMATAPAGGRKNEGKAKRTKKGAREGKYVYCVVEGSGRRSFGKIGLDGNEVYAMPYKDISAVVHDCPLKPYKVNEEDMTYALKHGDVVDHVFEKLGACLPMRFDTIVESEEKLRGWLAKGYEKFREKLERFKGKVEVGIQVFWDQKLITQEIAEESEEIKRLKEEMKTKPKGTTYFYKMKVERALKGELERRADKYYKKHYESITSYADEVRVNKLGKPKAGELTMFMNLSLLVQRDKVHELGKELAEIKREKSFDVKFTGPWPPYSFV